MSTALHGYRESRGGDQFPLAALREWIERNGQPGEAELLGLSEQLALPPSAIRGAISFYADLHEPPEASRYCGGTSCALAGADDLGVALKIQGPCRKVYCLGYCDQSPAMLDRDGRAFVHCRRGSAGEPARGATRVRAESRAAIVTRRIGQGDFSEFAKARAAGAYKGLERALELSREDVVRALEASGERGRGGAAFPTGSKWRTCAETGSEIKYVIANGDEGDPGSFIDRVLLEQDPHSILEGMAICAYAVGASEGIVFIRSEYPAAFSIMKRAIHDATEAGALGAFRVRAFQGLGSYVCGEETAMLNTIEGFRGEVRLRPPYPAQAGLYGKPTVVDNVETLVNVGWIFEKGAEAYRALGTEGSSGTKAFSLNHGFARPGIVEVEFGMPLRTVIEEYGGGCAGDAVILGGPMGSIVFRDEWEVPVCYDAMAARGIQLGHAGLVALPAHVDWRRLLLHWLEFMSNESCGKCVPCRLGSKQALAIAQGSEAPDLDALLEIMEEGSLCAFGKLMPGPMRTMLRRLAARNG